MTERLEALKELHDWVHNKYWHDIPISSPAWRQILNDIKAMIEVEETGPKKQKFSRYHERRERLRKAGLIP